MKPQLAKTAEPDDLDRLLKSRDWALEEKFDGDRLLIAYTGTDLVRAFTRQGVEAWVPRIKTARSVLQFQPMRGAHPGTTIIDGEVMPDGVFNVFDIPMLSDLNTKDLTYLQRRDILCKTFHLWGQPSFTIVASETDPDLKAARLREIEQTGREGVMFKHTASTYKFDNRSSMWLKWKLYKTCSAIITEMNREGKPEAVTICVYDGDVLHELSGCKIPSRYQDEQGIVEGDVIEVRYLNVSPDFRLIQPIFLKKRRDITPRECTKEQLT